MSSERFEMRVPTDLLERVDAVRGFEKRASWIKRAMESALTRGDDGALLTGSEMVERERPIPLVTPGAFNIPPGSLKERWLEPGPSSGCPECGGPMAGGVCGDCGFRAAS